MSESTISRAFNLSLGHFTGYWSTPCTVCQCVTWSIYWILEYTLHCWSICHLVILLDTGIHSALLVNLSIGQFTGYWSTPCTVCQCVTWSVHWILDYTLHFSFICQLVISLDAGVHPALLVNLSLGHFAGYWNTLCTVS